METKKVFLGIAAAVFIMGFASCTKERNSFSNNLVDEGTDTYMSVSIAFPKNSQTRAPGDSFDPNVHGDEAKINHVDIFVYSTESGTFSSYARLLANQFNEATEGSNSDIYVAKVKVKTTTGKRTVYAGINLPDDIVENIKFRTQDALYNGVMDVLGTTIIHGDNGFAMFSVAGQAKELVEENDANYLANNSVTLQCKRLVAKVTVEADENIDTSELQGKVLNLRWAISNFNKKMFLINNTVPFKDPNWDVYNVNDFSQEGQNHNTPVIMRESGVTPVYDPRYASENTSELNRQKEITRVTVRGTYVPKYITTITKQMINSVDTYVSHDVIENPLYTALDNDPNYDLTGIIFTFYAITVPSLGNTFYFLNSDDMLIFRKEFLAENGNNLEWSHYDKGYAYWNIFLNKDPNPLTQYRRWDVMRNDYYKCNITKIKSIGMPAPGVIDPELPPDIETKMDVTIEVLFWNTPIWSDYEL